MKATEDYLKTFAGIIAAKGYIPQQVFNCDETGHFWKKIPRRTYITTEEKRMLDYKSTKDRLTLTLCTNVSGDYKIKLLLIYHLEKSRAYKSHKNQKEKSQENNLPLQALLVLDNAPSHLPNLKDDILEGCKFIKVLYFPPNTISILQPIDQQEISNFKKLFTKHLFRCCFAVMGNTNLTLQEFWKDNYYIRKCLRIIDMAQQGFTKRTLASA
eukprot:XP_014775097.1 PREDICTED: tigger transposable element-derived protein 1-like [Octopus bimaculoides]